MHADTSIAPSLFAVLPAGHPRTVAHLLSCRRCRETALSEMLASDEPFGSETSSEADYSRWSPASVAAEALPADRAASAFTVPVADESRAVITRLVDTLEHIPTDGLKAAWKSKRYARPEVLASLLTRGEQSLCTEPYHSERLGLMGLFLAGQIQEDVHWVPRGLVRSGLLVGAARRLQGKLKEAGQAFQHVGAFLIGAHEEAAYSREVALLRWQQGKSCDAAALLTEAAERFAEAGEPEREAVCWALLGLLRREDADRERAAHALAPLLRSLRNLNARARPMLALRVRLALVLCEAERGDHQKARALLNDAHSLVAPGMRRSKPSATRASRSPGPKDGWPTGRASRGRPSSSFSKFELP